jgi:Xaa-Pro aminopeptidase
MLRFAPMGRPLALVAGLLLVSPPAAPAQGTAPPAFDKAEFAARRDRLFALIPDGIAIVFAGNDQLCNCRFRQAPDFWYLTGIEQPGAVLLLNATTRQATVFVLHQLGSGPESADLYYATDAMERWGVNVRPMENFFTLLALASARPAVQKLYLPLTSPDDQLHARFERAIVDAQGEDQPLRGGEPTLATAIGRIRQAEPQLAVADVNPFLDQLRWVKSPYEIARMRKAAAIGAAAVMEGMRGTRPGMFEYEIAAAAQYVTTRLGARGDAFPPIVPSGPNATDVHYEANSRQMQAGELVYLDYGADVDYYESDITRVWPVSGKFTVEQEAMYRTVLDVRNAVIAAMKPGITVHQMQDVAESVYARHGYRDAFVSGRRYIGHYVGISVHDVGGFYPPADQVPFRPGVVFNVEPVLEFPDRGVHLRLEDTILITESGAENLTAGVPAEVDRVLALVKEKGVNSLPVAPAR